MKIPYSEFCDFVKEHISYINSENEEFMNSLYETYTRRNNRKITIRGISSCIPKSKRSVLAKDFWLKRGWDEKSSIEKISLIQSERTSFKKRIEKGKSIKETSEKRKLAQMKSKERMIEMGCYEKVCKSKGLTYEDLYERGMTKEEAKEYMRKKNGKFFKKRWDSLRKGEITFFTNTQIGYYLEKGLSEQQAEEALSERQSTFSLLKLSEKYGKEEGYKKWKLRQERWQKTLNKKSTKEKLEILSKKLKNYKRYSFKSIKAFQEILNFFPDVTLICGSKEKFIWDEVANRIWFYDLFVPELNLIVEYQGLLFHPKPETSNEDLEKWKCPFSKKSGKIKLKEDLQKKDCAERKGYTFFWLWEDEDSRTFFHRIYNLINEKYEAS